MKKFPLYRSVRNEYSLKHFNIRSTKDDYLFNDFEDFVAKHDLSLSNLVDMLVEQRFSHARFTDHEYPL